MPYRISVESEGEDVASFNVAQKSLDVTKLQTLAIGNLSQGKGVEIKVEVGENSYAGGVARSLLRDLQNELNRLRLNSKIEVEDLKHGENYSNKSVIKITP
ncbi:MAG TPA: hypothetical protein VFI61_03690 [Patescibacteria group bacterium]|nr:hypothetical protein [Patescibacteria group bacterium]